MQNFKAQNAQISYVTLGSGTGPVILWAHGWGQNHRAFLPLAESLSTMGRHILVDFPGFGQAPAPATALGTEQYADAMAEFLKEVAKDGAPVLWVGHSFGCRVALQMGSKYPQMIKAMFLIAGAGLKRKRPIHKQISMKARIALYKTLKRIVPTEKLAPYFGSADYRNSGVMRPILVKVINEDLSPQAKNVNCPVMLAYGTKDTETPPEIGKRLNNMIPGSELLLFDGLDHYTIIGESRHQVAPHLKKFIEKNANA